MTQGSLWHNEQHSYEFAELCNALYERELRVLANLPAEQARAIQGRLKSLPHYIKQTADKMLQVQTPLELDTQNASWSAKQSSKIPLSDQSPDDVWQWYTKYQIEHGLIIPVCVDEHIVLDSVDRVDNDAKKFRTNRFGWFEQQSVLANQQPFQLLKPNKKIMMAAAAGHSWKNGKKARPVMPTLRELLLSCAINWRNFKKPLPINH